MAGQNKKRISAFLINSCGFLKFLIILSVCGIDNNGSITRVLGPTVAKQSREFYHRRGE